MTITKIHPIIHHTFSTNSSAQDYLYVVVAIKYAIESLRANDCFTKPTLITNYNDIIRAGPGGDLSNLNLQDLCKIFDVDDKDYTPYFSIGQMPHDGINNKNWEFRCYKRFADMLAFANSIESVANHGNLYLHIDSDLLITTTGHILLQDIIHSMKSESIQEISNNNVVLAPFTKTTYFSLWSKNALFEFCAKCIPSYFQHCHAEVQARCSDMHALDFSVTNSMLKYYKLQLTADNQSEIHSLSGFLENRGVLNTDSLVPSFEQIKNLVAPTIICRDSNFVAPFRFIHLQGWSKRYADIFLRIIDSEDSQHA